MNFLTAISREKLEQIALAVCQSGNTEIISKVNQRIKHEMFQIIQVAYKSTYIHSILHIKLLI